jgi:hypothetical protein
MPGFDMVRRAGQRLAHLGPLPLAPAWRGSVLAEPDFLRLWVVGLVVFAVRWLEMLAVAVFAYQRQLAAAGIGAISTEIADPGPFYFAEDYHQQYLAKNPYGYCGLGGTGVACPIPAKAAAG